MAKIPAEIVDRWRATAAEWIAANCKNATIESVVLGRDAWTVAHRAGLTEEAYRDRGIHDAHIQTALQAIFPNVVFRDAKRY